MLDRFQNLIDQMKKTEGFRQRESLHMFPYISGSVEPDESKRFGKSKQVILPVEIAQLEDAFKALGLLDQNFIVKHLEVSGSIFLDETDYESNIHLVLRLHLSKEAFEILATRHDEITPSTALGRNFALVFDCTNTNGELKLDINLTDPQISEYVLWHRFTSEELSKLSAERAELLDIVQNVNEVIAPNLSIESVQPIVELVASIVGRVNAEQVSQSEES